MYSDPAVSMMHRQRKITTTGGGMQQNCLSFELGAQEQIAFRGPQSNVDLHGRKHVYMYLLHDLLPFVYVRVSV